MTWSSRLSFFLAVSFCSSVAAALPTFPGAEGTSAEAIGGRGGTVYVVDTLSDDPGKGLTFREACEASGPRMVVFAVSGWIDLTSTLAITQPHITIAGQTSPGGIGVRGESVRVTADQVVATHFRFAAGSLRGDERDSLQIWGPADNVLLDHCSIRWGCDESGETAFNPRRVTISWSVIGPGLYNCAPERDHNLGFLVWGGDDSEITFHHNFFAHNRYRNPEVNGGSGGADAPRVDVVNNVTFDTFGGYTGFHSYAGESRANLVHNYVKKGSSNNADAREGILFGGESNNGDASYYVVGNAGAWRASWDDTTPGHTDWDALKTQWNGSTPHSSWMRATPHVFSGIPVKHSLITDAYAKTIVAAAGATRPVIDAADAAYKSNFENGVHAFFDGAIVGKTADSYPALPSLMPPADVDSDGMADTWELSRGLIVGTDDSAADDDNDGYTNIEEYLHVLGGYTNGSESKGGAGGMAGAHGGGDAAQGGRTTDGKKSPEEQATEEGCSCRTAGAPSRGQFAWGPILVLALAARRRQRSA